MIYKKKLLEFLNETFDLSIKDLSNNGLQIDGKDEIKKIAFAVDSDLKVIRNIEKNKVDFLIVHHGLFWQRYYPIKNELKEKLKILINNNINLFAVHLPLDFHEKLSHSIAIARLISTRFARIGFNNGIAYFRDKRDLDSLLEIIKEKIDDNPRIFFNSKDFSGNVYVCSGRCNFAVDELNEDDLLITGELNYENIIKANENSINLIILGHYNSEKFGLINLMNEIRSRFSKFDLEYLFIENKFNKGIK